MVYVLNDMMYASKTMMEKLRKLEVLIRVMGVKIEARWFSSAVICLADALSRTWDSGGMWARTDVAR